MPLVARCSATKAARRIFGLKTGEINGHRTFFSCDRPPQPLPPTAADRIRHFNMQNDTPTPRRRQRRVDVSKPLKLRKRNSKAGDAPGLIIRGRSISPTQLTTESVAELVESLADDAGPIVVE